MTRSRTERDAVDAQLRSAGFFYLRTPLLPFAELVAWRAGVAAGDLAALRARLRAIVDRPAVREAIFVASPSLAADIAVWQREPETERGQRIERGLVRYVARMCGRATPFGELAGCTLGTTGPTTRLAVAELATYRTHTRLDATYVTALVDDLVQLPPIEAAIAYRPSTSLYRIAGQYRYMEATRAPGGHRRYGLVAIPATPELERVLARAAEGARRSELAAVLAEDPTLAPDEIAAYIADLIVSQVLVADLAPRVTGPEPLDELIAHTTAVPEVCAALRVVRDQLAELDVRPLGGREPAFRALADHLAELGTPIDPARLVQVDLRKPATDATLGADVIDEISRALALLHRIGPAAEDHPLADLVAAFVRRYEGREVPLVEVLDEEWGIVPPRGDPSPLLAGLPFGAAGGAGGSELSALQGYLARRIAFAVARGEHTLALDAEDLERRATAQPAPLPRSLAAMVTIAAASTEAIARGELAIVIEGAAGGSGTMLLGRFCHGDPALAAHRTALAAAEQAAEPDAIYAELVHTPQPRSLNITARPVLGEYELVYLGGSGVPADRRITLDDLVVAAEHGELVLRSRRLGRRVIPRLSSAHTLARGLLPFRFLGLLGPQARLGLPLGPLEDLPFVPRIAVGRAVLRLATWQLFDDELATFDRPTRAERFAAVQAVRAARRLPRWVALRDRDNELPVDLDNEIAVESFVQLVKRRAIATLVELFPGEAELCAEGPEGRFVHELIVPFHNTAAPATVHRAPRPATHAVRRFAPGSPWLYAKLYTAATAADRVLGDVVAPLVADARQRGCDGWFFIRYADPECHLRVRLHGERTAELLEVLHRHGAAPLADGLLHRIQLDTYEREIERYGGDAGIELAEQWFCADSDAVLAIVQELDVARELDDRWRIALLGIEALFDDIGFDLAARHAVIREQRDAFAAEHGVGVMFQRGLGVTYRRERAALEAMLAGEHDFDRARDALAERSRRSEPIFAALRRHGIALPELAKSLIHMHANRCLRASARAHELVIYDLLERCYTSRVARSRPLRAGGV